MLFNDSSGQTTNDILDWNELCAVAILREKTEVERCLLRGDEMPTYLQQKLELGCTLDDVHKHFAACQAEINLSSILFIVACTESRIRFDAEERANRCSDALGKSLARRYKRGSQDWKVPFRDGILSDWKSYARNSLAQSPIVEQCVQGIGNFGRPLDTRHWVAHGRYWSPSWSVNDNAVADAAAASEKLIESLREIANLGGIAHFV